MGGRTGSPMAGRPDEERVQVVEEPTCRLGGPVYKDVQPKTYQILEQQLPPEEAPGGFTKGWGVPNWEHMKVFVGLV